MEVLDNEKRQVRGEMEGYKVKRGKGLTVFVIINLHRNRTTDVTLNSTWDQLGITALSVLKRCLGLIN